MASQHPKAAKRGVFKTLIMTLLFHVFAMLNGLLLVALLVLTLGGLGLIVLCTLSASTRSSRLFVAWLWRTELWINGFVGEKQTETERRAQEQARGLRREASTMPASTSLSRSSSTRGREVTPSVMVFSVLYFLLFKGFFSVIFAAVPLTLWWIVVVQIAPSLAPDPDMVLTNNTTSRVFVALTSSFFAYQIGVAAAAVSVYVSDKIQDLLFPHTADPAASAPLLGHDSFRGGHRYDDAQPRPHDELFSLDEHLEAQRDISSSMSGPPPPPAPPQPPRPPADPHFPFGVFPPVPPMPPMPPMAGGRRRPGLGFEDAYRAEPVMREIDVCGIKVTIHSQPGEDSGGRGRGRGAPNFRGGPPHRGGGRGGMGRGGFFHPGMTRGMVEPPPMYGTFEADFPGSEPGPEVFARVIPDESGRSSSDPEPPMAAPVFGRSFSTSPRRSRRKGGGRLRRSDSFGSSQPPSNQFAPNFDLKHGAHTRLWEALDLRPSAPNMSEEYPSARPLAQGPLPPVMQPNALHKSWSANAYRSRHEYSDESDTSTGFRKFELFAAKRQLKEQSRQLKEAARQLKREYKEQAKRDARDAARTKEHKRYIADSERYAAEQERYAREFAREEEQRAKELEREAQRRSAMQQKQIEIQQKQAEIQRRQAEVQQKQGMEGEAQRALQQQLRFQAAPEDAEDEGKHETHEPSSSDLEREQDIQTRDEYAMEIERAAQEEVERQRRELEASSAAVPVAKPFTVSRVVSNDSLTTREGSRIRGRRTAGSVDYVVGTADSGIDDREFVSGGRRSSSARMLSAVNPYQTGTLTDQEIQDIYGSLPRTSDDRHDANGLGQFGGISFSSSPALIRTLDSGPLYRGLQPNASPTTISTSGARDYDTMSPINSPTGYINNSFIESRPYDVLSPTNSLHDADFPSEESQHVYRSIRYTDDNRVVPSQVSSLPHYEDVPGTRDKVHFCSYAPPSVYPSKQSFRFAIWAFLLNQRHEMREQAEAADPDAQQLSINTKMVVRRGAIVHVTLDAPEGFKILNGATQGFPWEGKISSVAYDIECTDNADFGQVLFKASIVVGTEVAVLRSYVIVASRRLDPGELEPKMLDSQLEVLDMTYQEIPYPTLELKEFVGSGYFGDAYRASYKGEDVVVKTIRASEFGETNDQILKEFQHEAAVLNMFGHHPCVVPFVGASTDMRYPLSLITKYLPYGSLEDNLKNPDMSSRLSTDQRTRMLKDAAAGLLNIHEGGFIHRDVAARNCLVDRDLCVKICDFGLCRRVNAYGGSLMKESVGPIKYMAPESLQPPHSFSYDSDSWMFGVLMWETYTATPPFQSKTPIEAGMAVLHGERLEVPQDLPQELQALMESCFHETPSQRPSMAEIMLELERATAPKAPPAKSRSTAGAFASIPPSGTPAELGRHDLPIWV